MNNHPFILNSTNVIDESFFTATPTFVNGQNVFVSQEKQRKLFDTLSTTITGTPQSSGYPQFYSGNYIQAERYYGPHGIVYSFPSTHPNPQINRWSGNSYPLSPNVLRTDLPNSSSPSYPITYPGMGLRSPEYQEQLAQNPFYFQAQQLPAYKFKFHLNESTSCSDLLNTNNQVPGFQGTPDFQNLAGIMYQQGSHIRYQDYLNRLPENPIVPNVTNEPSNVKRLVINKCYQPPRQHVADILDEQKREQLETKDDKKTVTFNNQLEKAEKSEQTYFPCNCADNKNKRDAETSNNDSRKNAVKKFFRKKLGSYRNGSNNSERGRSKQKRTSNGKIKKAEEEKRDESEYDTETSDSECRCSD